MSDELLIEWPEPGICIMRMNRPQAYNALSRDLLAQMQEVVDGLAQTAARVLILAATEPGFCAGADLKERKSLTENEKYLHNRQINALANALQAAPVCTIAAINGVAMGGGLELSLACDLRFASDTARIGLTEARIGAIPGAGGTQRLPRLLGTARALEMMFSGEPVQIDDALAWGLVNGVTHADELEERCLAFARLIAKRSKSATATLKSVVYQGLDQPLAAGLEVERLAIVDILQSEDYREGLAAFAEKRPARF